MFLLKTDLKDDILNFLASFETAIGSAPVRAFHTRDVSSLPFETQALLRDDKRHKTWRGDKAKRKEVLMCDNVIKMKTPGPACQSEVVRQRQAVTRQCHRLRNHLRRPRDIIKTSS